MIDASELWISVWIIGCWALVAFVLCVVFWCLLLVDCSLSCVVG